MASAYMCSRISTFPPLRGPSPRLLANSGRRRAQACCWRGGRVGGDRAARWRRFGELTVCRWRTRTALKTMSWCHLWCERGFIGVVGVPTDRRLAAVSLLEDSAHVDVSLLTPSGRASLAAARVSHSRRDLGQGGDACL